MTGFLRPLYVSLVSIFVLFVVDDACAEERRSSKETSFDLSVSPVHQFSVDIDGGGSFSQSSALLRLSATRSIAESSTLGLNFKYEADDYDFSGGGGFGGARPWNDIRRFGLSIPFFTRFENNWSFSVSPSIDWLQESGAKSSDSISYGVVAFAFKSLTRDKSLGIGAGVFHDIDDDVRVFPFIVVDWRFNERWRLANPFDAEALGPAGLELSYSINDQWHLGVGGVYRSYRFRLNEQGVAPNGVGKNKGVATFLRLRWETSSNFNMDFYAGAILGGKLELEDSDGRDLSSADYDAAPFVAITFRLSL